eukprot:3750634-Prymnesium_polylepis.1
MVGAITNAAVEEEEKGLVHWERVTNFAVGKPYWRHVEMGETRRLPPTSTPSEQAAPPAPAPVPDPPGPFVPTADTEDSKSDIMAGRAKGQARSGRSSMVHKVLTKSLGGVCCARRPEGEKL